MDMTSNFQKFQEKININPKKYEKPKILSGAAGYPKRGMENVSGTFFERHRNAATEDAPKMPSEIFRIFARKNTGSFLRNFSKSVLPRVRSMRQKRTRRCAFPERFSARPKGDRARIAIFLFAVQPLRDALDVHRRGRERERKPPCREYPHYRKVYEGAGVCVIVVIYLFCIIDYSDVE